MPFSPPWVKESSSLRCQNFRGVSKPDSVVTVSRRVCLVSQTPILSSFIDPVRSMSNRIWHDGDTRHLLSKGICAFCLFPVVTCPSNSPLGITCLSWFDGLQCLRFITDTLGPTSPHLTHPTPPYSYEIAATQGINDLNFKAQQLIPVDRSQVYKSPHGFVPTRDSVTRQVCERSDIFLKHKIWAFA